jgi:periplasmic divalent cation tolerance protein
VSRPGPRRPAAGIQITVAVPSPAVASRIAAALLDAHLCACAQTLGPIRSHYEWQGKRELSREWLLVIKTRPALFNAVARRVRELHPYELPEIVACPMRPAWRPYLEWIALQTRDARLAAGTAGRRRPR